MSATISIAQDSVGRMIHINDVDKTKNETFTCKECGSILISVKTEARGKDWHYRHSTDSDIAKCRSTALHDYAIQVLFESRAIVLREHIKIDYSNPEKEARVGADFRSDVKVDCNDKAVHFEVFVTHDLEDRKIKYYRDNKIKCIRIDLSAKNLLNASPEEIKKAVLDQVENKTFIYWVDEEINPDETSNENSNTVVGIVFAAIIILLVWLGVKNHKKRK